MKAIKQRLRPIVLNAIVGDGCIVKQNNGSYLQFTSTSLDWITFKRDLCKEFKPTNLRTQPSGYGGKKTIYVFSTPQHDSISKSENFTIEECIEMLTKTDLIMWYLDDGTYHQKKHFMHLYCNMFTEEQSELLADKIFSLYPVKRPSLRWDKKKDGRKYPYLYIPVKTSNEFKIDVENFLKENDIQSLFYKVGI